MNRSAFVIVLAGLVAFSVVLGPLSCSDDKSVSPAPTVKRDTVSPHILWTEPAIGDLSVPRTRSILVAFSEPIDSASVGSSAIVMTPPTPGRTRASGSQVSYIPDSLLDSGVYYHVEVSASIRDTAGNALGTAYTWQFATSVDTVRPVVVSMEPAAGATWVSTNTHISVSFSEPMDPATFSRASLELVPDVAGTFTHTDSIWTFSPAFALDSATTYTVMIDTTAKDRSGNALASPYVWSFATPYDTVRPVVQEIVPKDGDSVLVITEIRVTFSEPMDTTTLSANSISFNPPVLGTYVCPDKRRVVITPEQPLELPVDYLGTVSTDVADTAGNHLATPYVFHFAAGKEGAPYSIYAINGLCYRGSMGGGIDSPPPRFEVLDQSGRPLLRPWLFFSLVEGDGELSVDSALANANGIISNDYLFSGQKSYGLIRTLVPDVDVLDVKVRASVIRFGPDGQGQFVKLYDSYDDVCGFNGQPASLDHPVPTDPLYYVNYQTALGVVPIILDVNENGTLETNDPVVEVILNTVYNKTTTEGIGVGSSINAVRSAYGTPDVFFYDPTSPPAWGMQYNALGALFYASITPPDSAIIEIHLWDPTARVSIHKLVEQRMQSGYRERLIHIR